MAGAGERRQGAASRSFGSQCADPFGGPWKVHPIAALQTEYSLWTRDPEGRHFGCVPGTWHRFCRLQPRWGEDFLTGQFKKFEDLPADDYRRTSPRFPGRELPEKSRPLVRRVETIAREKSCTPSQLAVAWGFWHRGSDIIPISRHESGFNISKKNAGAMDVRLSPEDPPPNPGTLPARRCPPGCAIRST